MNRRAAVFTVQGVYHQARVLHADALRVAREIALPLDEAEALEGLAESHLAKGRIEEGIDHLRRSLDVYGRLGAPDIHRVSARLDSLSRTV